MEFFIRTYTRRLSTAPFYVVHTRLRTVPLPKRDGEKHREEEREREKERKAWGRLCGDPRALPLMGTWYELFVGCSLAFSHCCATTSSFLHVLRSRSSFFSLFSLLSFFHLFLRLFSCTLACLRGSLPSSTKGIDVNANTLCTAFFSTSGSSRETSEIRVYTVGNCCQWSSTRNDRSRDRSTFSPLYSSIVIFIETL